MTGCSGRETRVLPMRTKGSQMRAAGARIGLLSLGLMAILGADCGNKNAADSASAPPPPASGTAGVPVGMPPQAAAAAQQQRQGMEAQKRMNEEMAKARQAAEQGKK